VIARTRKELLASSRGVSILCILKQVLSWCCLQHAGESLTNDLIKQDLVIERIRVSVRLEGTYLLESISTCCYAYTKIFWATEGTTICLRDEIV
jgi:hypothetical protein